MIYKISGTVVEKLNRSIVVDVGGVGYEVQVKSKDLQNILISSNISLYTQLIISETEHMLYGFLEHNSLTLFKLLKTVSGIGPRTSFNILDAGTTQEIIKSISEADKSFFKKVSGVGPKSALKIIVELQDKLGKIKELDLSPMAKQDEELTEALVLMGYDRDRIEEVVKSLDSSIPEAKKLQEAIKVLSKNA